MKRTAWILGLTFVAGMATGLIADRARSAQPEAVKRTVLLKTALEGIQGKDAEVFIVELAPGDDIPEHTEVDRDQEEVFYIVSGTPTIVIDDDKHPSQPGTFVRLDPGVKRTVVNHGDDQATVLIISAPRTSGYEPMSWA